jgi:uncharacterized membrane protein YdbT with pleckstrin-like domain
VSSYIDDSLIEGETILHRARVSWWSQFWLVLLGILLVVVVVGVFFLAAAWIKVRSTEIAITNRRVIAKFGFVKRDTVEINLDKVEALRVEQGFLGRMLNFGTILISGAGTSVAPLKDIADPLVFRRKFMEATNRPLVRQ